MEYRIILNDWVIPDQINKFRFLKFVYVYTYIKLTLEPLNIIGIQAFFQSNALWGLVSDFFFNLC